MWWYPLAWVKKGVAWYVVFTRQDAAEFVESVKASFPHVVLVEGRAVSISEANFDVRDVIHSDLTSFPAERRDALLLLAYEGWRADLGVYGTGWCFAHCPGPVVRVGWEMPKRAEKLGKGDGPISIAWCRVDLMFDAEAHPAEKQLKNKIRGLVRRCSEGTGIAVGWPSFEPNGVPGAIRIGKHAARWVRSRKGRILNFISVPSANWGWMPRHKP